MGSNQNLVSWSLLRFPSTFKMLSVAHLARIYQCGSWPSSPILPSFRVSRRLRFLSRRLGIASTSGPQASIQSGASKHRSVPYPHPPRSLPCSSRHRSRRTARNGPSLPPRLPPCTLPNPRPTLPSRSRGRLNFLSVIRFARLHLERLAFQGRSVHVPRRAPPNRSARRPTPAEGFRR